ncbi:MAG: HNH endonuclease signature motif containing protein [Bdellovibrionota bacterium]
MITLKTLTDSELLIQTYAVVSEERKIGTQVLRHLREIETRRLYAEKYSSLHEFVVHELKYSDGAAYRRIQAMRLIREIPEVEVSLEKGDVSLSVVSTLQTFFKAEKKLDHEYTPQAKLKLIKKAEGKSTREIERELALISPQAIPKEKERVLSPTQTQLTLVISRDLEEKLKRIKDLLAHQNPDPSYAELIEKTADLALQKLDPTRKQTVAKHPTTKPASAPKLVTKSPKASKDRRFIPQGLRQEVWIRAQGRCEHRHAKTSHRCNSRFALEVDHITPVGRGGVAAQDNLQVLCRTHNQYKNLKDYGFYWKKQG